MTRERRTRTPRRPRAYAAVMALAFAVAAFCLAALWRMGG